MKSRKPTNSDADEPQNNQYIVVTDNIETGTLLFGTYKCDSPETAVRRVLSGDYQSPPSDPAYEISAEDTTQFTVYKIADEPTTVTRTEASTNGSWHVTETRDTITITYNTDHAIELPRDTIGELITAIGTVYPEPDRFGGSEPVTSRPPVYDAFVNVDVGPVRAYAATPSEDAIMWVDFTEVFPIPSTTDAQTLLNLLVQLYPEHAP